MYQIKQLPEDFVVNEVLDLKTEEGSFSYYKLTKNNISLDDALEVISEKLNIKRKFINFAGTKDKKAVTTQTISISKGPKKDFDFGNVRLDYVGMGKERINLGQLKGNTFEIIIRNIEKMPEPKTKFVNSFGEQRFGIHKNNHEVGKLLLKRDFKSACALIDNRKIQAYLREKPTDFIGALRQLNKKILMMYIHAYQSHLWNALTEKHKEDIILPLIGFETENNEAEALLKKDGLSTRDFIFREIPELSSSGDSRNIYAEAEKLEIGIPEDDELNKGKKKLKLKFFLKKGSYATEFIRQVML